MNYGYHINDSHKAHSSVMQGWHHVWLGNKIRPGPGIPRRWGRFCISAALISLRATLTRSASPPSLCNWATLKTGLQKEEESPNSENGLKVETPAQVVTRPLAGCGLGHQPALVTCQSTSRTAWWASDHVEDSSLMGIRQMGRSRPWGSWLTRTSQKPNGTDP